ncbi:MAG: UTP--glucose-1-phosphate uridylyltransferase [Nocardioidaceae bacterium]
MSAEGLAEARRVMTEAGVHPLAIEVFVYYYGLLERGETGTITETAIDPVEPMVALADLQVGEEDSRTALDKTVVIKLNGGLGTSMGMDRAKSLVPVRGDQRFLDLIAQQILGMRKRLGVRLPVMFMNSFRTRRDALAALADHPGLEVDGLPLDFLQNQEPKLRSDDLTPVRWPPDPVLAWCPPGHGDLYTALRASGTLAALTGAGYQYAFVSNADNLGAVPDPRVAGWFATSGAPFAAEACRRTASDRKGGHLAVRRSDGRLVVRESAQTRPEDEATFGDINRHRYFNTNSLWLDLHELSDELDACDGVLRLPLIRNVKNVDPSDSSSPEVIQIETAMGAAVELFDGATAIEVDRSRFLPVKTTNDLLVLRSDVYRVNDQGGLEIAPERGRPAPFVDLDPAYYKLLADFDARFPAGPPSLVEADRFVVRGDVVFEAGYMVRGDVTVDRR